MTKNEARTTGSQPFLVFCRNYFISFLFFLLFSLSNTLLWAGSLDSPAVNDAMYSLESIYNRLDTGATGSKYTTFIEPSSGPGATDRTLDEVMAKTPVVDDTNGVLRSEVRFGKTYWGLRNGEWGVQTGTYKAIPVYRTGQTKCYDPTGVTANEIPCAGTGQDGELQKGAHHAFPRFTDNQDGTVTDNSTGLIWLKNANCFGEKIWEEALTVSNTLANGSCGLSDGSSAGDWHLPSLPEMNSLIIFQEYPKGDPAISPGHPFTDIANSPFTKYSTSTSSMDIIGKNIFIQEMKFSFVVSTSVSSVGIEEKVGKYSALYVWPVR